MLRNVYAKYYFFFKLICDLQVSLPLQYQNGAQNFSGIEEMKDSAMKEITYSWKDEGFTDCSATCLGGIKQSLINCVRDSDGITVQSYLCKSETRPEIFLEICNDYPCPPTWKVSEFQTCSKSCSIGIQIREVTCVRYATRDDGNPVIFPNGLCSQPPPQDRRYCNIFDCPARWYTSKWSKCSKSCEGGIKMRHVECKQVMAQDHEIIRSAAKCPSQKPHDKEPCNAEPCSPESDRPYIAISNTTYTQISSITKHVTLRIGGRAVVYSGTQVEIECPVEKFNRTKIQWTKNYSFIVNNMKYSILKNGALQIHNIKSQDEGEYSCIAGHSKADLYLSVKDKSGVITSSEETEQQQSNEVSEWHNDVNMKNIAYKWVATWWDLLTLLFILHVWCENVRKLCLL